MTVERTPELEDLIEEIVTKTLVRDNSIIAYPEWIRRAIAQAVATAQRQQWHNGNLLGECLDEECECTCHCI
jgi:hypothetical protein